MRKRTTTAKKLYHIIQRVDQDTEKIKQKIKSEFVVPQVG